MELVVSYVIMPAVMCLMMGVGLGTSLEEVLRVARRVPLIVRGVLANFVIVPIVIFLVVVWLPIPPAVKGAAMLMAAAPVAPMAPPFAVAAKGDLPYAVGIMIIIALLSVVLTPLILVLALPATEEGLNISSVEIIKTLVIVQLIPISVGMAIRGWSEKWSKRLVKIVPRLGQIGLLVGVGLVIASQVNEILSAGWLSHAVLFGLSVACLLIGDRMLAGQAPELRRSLAVSTAIRNVPLAFLIADTNFPGTAVAAMTLVFSVFTMLVSIAYARLQGGDGTQVAEA
jgi:BASS family bile acid:Na+ symporter